MTRPARRPHDPPPSPRTHPSHESVEQVRTPIAPPDRNVPHGRMLWPDRFGLTRLPDDRRRQ